MYPQVTDFKDAINPVDRNNINKRRNILNEI